MSHVIMKKNLAKALMDSGMEHFDLGGMLGLSNNYQAHGPSGNDVSQAQLETNNAITQNQNNVQALQGNYRQGLNNQATLGQMLLAQSQGQGPNPAQLALNNATGQNIQAQGALMAGQRGAGSNVGLMARQAAQQGAGIEQQAAGQSALMQAQQQLAAQQQMGQLAGNQIGQNQTALQGYTNSAFGNQNALLGANAQADALNEKVAAGNSALNGQIFGGLMSAAGAGAGMYLAPKPPTPAPTGSATAMGGFNGLAQGPAQQLAATSYYKGGPIDASNGASIPGQPQYQGNDKRNDVVPALLSKGEVVLPNSVTQSEDPINKAVEFLKHLKGSQDSGYEKVVKARSKNKSGGKK